LWWLLFIPLLNGLKILLKLVLENQFGKKERKIFVFTPSLTSGLLARFPLGPLGLPLLSTLFLGRPASEATTAAAASPLSPLSR
jgi:hypothetical protein